MQEATTDLEAIEKEFEALKQEVFDDKIRNLESEIEQIKSGNLLFEPKFSYLACRHTSYATSTTWRCGRTSTRKVVGF